MKQASAKFKQFSNGARTFSKENKIKYQTIINILIMKTKSVAEVVLETVSHCKIVKAKKEGGCKKYKF
jgi:hypothetical protein